uniref:Uncharacterized protein n=1 Tax=Aegilops tauschii subsp. strangulata TaxID=200361 RepID=A0A453NXI1_AEGTS
MQFFGLSLCLKFLTSCGCTPTTFADNPSGRTRLFAGTLSDLRATLGAASFNKDQLDLMGIQSPRKNHT